MTKKKTRIWDSCRIASESPVCEKSVIMPGFWGSILFYIAGHGKLFIADVDGKSASNEIPRFFLFCKTTLTSDSFLLFCRFN